MPSPCPLATGCIEPALLVATAGSWCVWRDEHGESASLVSRMAEHHHAHEQKATAGTACGTTKTTKSSSVWTHEATVLGCPLSRAFPNKATVLVRLGLHITEGA